MVKNGNMDTSRRPEETPEQKPKETNNLEESVNINFVEADDTAPPEKPRRFKKVFSNVFLSEDENEKKAARKKKSTFFVKNVPLITGGLLFCIHLLTPDEYSEVFYVNEKPYQYLPTDTQVNDVLVPIARIADRHTNITEINPDLLDILASGQAIVAYGMELRATMLLKRFLDEKERKEAMKNNNRYWEDYSNYAHKQDTPFSDMSNHFSGGESIGD
jgi:hypothetical protein